MSKLQRNCMIVAAIAVIVALLSSIATIQLTRQYNLEATHSPDPATGHVVMVHDQGIRVYVTATQKLLEDVAFALAMIAGTVAMGAFFLGQTTGLPKEDAPPA